MQSRRHQLPLVDGEAIHVDGQLAAQANQDREAYGRQDDPRDLQNELGSSEEREARRVEIPILYTRPSIANSSGIPTSTARVITRHALIRIDGSSDASLSSSFRRASVTEVFSQCRITAQETATSAQMARKSAATTSIGRRDEPSIIDRPAPAKGRRAHHSLPELADLETSSDTRSELPSQGRCPAGSATKRR
jgi:hypothetical protein